jgi:hypothetical protein
MIKYIYIITKNSYIIKQFSFFNLKNKKMKNISNNNSSSTIHCELTQSFDLNGFKYCYQYLFLQNMTTSILYYLLIITVILFNFLVVYLIKRNSIKLILFDKILIIHCTINVIRSITNMPFNHIITLFKYWPFDSISGGIFGSFNSSLNTITNLIMLYLTCARLRKIQYPRTYKQEMLFKSPILISMLICIIGILIWIPVYVLNDIQEFIPINHNILSYIILKVLTWFLPLILILIISCFIFYHFKKRNQNTLTTSNNQTYEMNKCLFEVIFNYKINSHTLFAIIMSFYWIQWIIPVSCDLLNDYQAFTEISIDGRYLFLQVDTVCLTEAFLLLMFNPMASILHKPQQNN